MKGPIHEYLLWLRRILQQDQANGREAKKRKGKQKVSLLLIKTNIYMVHPWNLKLEQDGMHFCAVVFRSGWNALEAMEVGSDRIVSNNIVIL